MQNGFFKTYGKVILFAFLGISIVAAVIGQNKQRNTLAVYTSTDVVQQETRFFLLHQKLPPFV